MSEGSATRSKWLLRVVSLLGVASLCYVLGAAMMFFELPSSTFLTRAFVGGAAWYEAKQQSPPPEDDLPPVSVGKVDRPERTCDGFTLLMYGGNSQAVLVNMRGDVVQRWHAPFSSLWPEPSHVRGQVDDATVYFNDGHLFPNGDLLALVEGPVDLRQGKSSPGYGLVRLDRESHVLWKYRDKCHHDVDVAEDGTVYAITNVIVKTATAGLEHIPTPCMVDCIDVISPDGTRLKRLPILEAIRDSPYAPLLCMLERPTRFGNVSPPAPPGVTPELFPDERRRRDVLHTNAVKVLGRKMAGKFPQFRAGQLLLSLRHLDALVVLDPDSGKVVWAARGPWRAQHDPSFLDNGHLLLFDNLGSPRGSRVLEYDPATQAFPWSYPGDTGKPFYSRIRGMTQRLPNGNTLVVNSDGGEVFEVTAACAVVWSCSCGRVELKRARRFTLDQLPFLKGEHRARP
jgi:hypothetical protein